MVLQQSQKHLTALGVELTFQLGVVQVGGRLTGTTPSPWPTAGPSPPVSSRGPAATSWPTDSTSPEPAGDSPVPKPSSSYEHSAATATSRHTGPGTSTENDTACTNRATSTAPFPEPPEVPPEEPHPKQKVGFYGVPRSGRLIFPVGRPGPTGASRAEADRATRPRAGGRAIGDGRVCWQTDRLRE